MAQNFFSFSLHERTQDAFVAWLCSCYNEPVSSVKHIVAEEFIKKLLGVKLPGVNVNFQSVEVETQIYGIDILLTLKNVNNSRNDYYVVIEDKTNSKIHDNQLVTYIRNLIAKGVSQNRIFVVYYKTGHIAKTPDCITLKDKDKCEYKFDPYVKSEYDEVMSIKKTTYPNLAGMKICDLDDIHDFFCNNPLISRCGCFILDDYAGHIDAEYNRYNSGVIDAKEGRTESQWGRIFDEAIERNKSKNLLFKLAFTGSYWEIYVTKKLTGTGVQTCTDPILNVRSTIFEEVRFTSIEKKTPKIYFFVFNRLTTSPALKKNEKSATYIIPTDNTTFYHDKLTSSNYLESNISEKDLKDLLDAICEEYERVCNSGFNDPFSLAKHACSVS